VDLRHRGRSQGCLLETRKAHLRRRAEFLSDDTAHFFICKRRDLALQTAEFACPFVRKKFGSAGEHLAHLDVNRSEFLQHQADRLGSILLDHDHLLGIEPSLHGPAQVRHRCVSHQQIKSVAPEGIVSLRDAQVRNDRGSAVFR